MCIDNHVVGSGCAGCGQRTRTRCCVCRNLVCRHCVGVRTGWGVVCSLCAAIARWHGQSVRPVEGPRAA